MLEKLRNAVLLVVGVLVAVWAISGLVGVVQGGSPEPPGPPPGPTMKDLDAVEPRIPLWPAEPGNWPIVIDQPGSYYLQENFYGEGGSNGITISADNVTLDLNGFALIGVPGSLDGVYVTESQWNISILNGTVRDWGQDGVDAVHGYNSQYEHLRLYWNGGDGIEAGLLSGVFNSTADRNGGDGIDTNGGIVSNCTAGDNGGNGITASDATVSNCTAIYNDGNGIAAWGGSLITGNVARANDAAGVYVAFNGDRIENNNVTWNARGIDADGAGNLIIKNSASGNTTADYDIIAGNTVGPIYGVADPIVGTNPWANFSY